MLLPANCPYAVSEGPLPWDERETIACCRAQGGEPPLCRCPGEDVYRFHWSSSFNGSGTVRIDRKGETITLWWAYPRIIQRLVDPGSVEDSDAGSVTLGMGEWNRMTGALGRASFWDLDPNYERMGFDGADWRIEGRSGNTFHVVTRWSVHEPAFHDLGCLFFELAGAPLAAVRLY